MITTQIQICSFCSQPLENPEHPCPNILYSLTNTIASAKQDTPSLLGDVHNLIFQGGGVKGISYLGSLQQLQIEGEKEGKDFLSGIQRIAGTSAGSMVALYLGLGLDLGEIEDLLKINFVTLLDDSLTLKVVTKFTDKKEGDTVKNVKAKEVFLGAMKYFKELEVRLTDDKKEVADKAEKEVRDLVNAIMTYFLSKLFGATAAFAINSGLILAELAGYPNKIAIQATEWLLNMLKPAKPQDPKKKLLKSNLETESSSDCSSRFEEIVKRECEKALIEAKREEHEPQENKKRGLKSAPPTAKQTSSMEQDALEYLAVNCQGVELDQDPKQDQLMEMRLEKPLQSDQLTGYDLYQALGELLYFITLGKENTEGIQGKLGLFDGSIVKQKLIKEPIRKAVGDLHKDPANITFKELWDLNSAAGNKFKKFYITSFNMETLRTEVFSVEHTPNIVIADAMRATMSIPIFFTPVTIRERTEKGLTERTIYASEGVEKVIHYMDGGVLDNYPIWIFDDFKYCVQDIPGFKPRMRYSMQNPHTLGFRLMDKRIIEIYTNPYLDPARKQMKQVNQGIYAETFGYQMGLLLNAEINQTQENEHIKRGDCARTAYVDNLGINAVQFELSEKDIKNMIEAGKQSVLNYKSRAALNGFVGEGEAYF